MQAYNFVTRLVSVVVTMLLLFSEGRRALVLLCLPVFLLPLLWTPGARGNHNKWWTCNDACARCARRVMPMEEMITQLYPGLFSTTPPTNALPVPDIVEEMKKLANASKGNYSVSGTAPLTSGAGTVNGTTSSGSNGSVYVDSISARPMPNIGNPSEPNPGNVGCCET